MGVRKILDIERDLERFIDMRNHRYFKRHKEHQINLDGQTMRGLYDSMGLGPRVLPAEVEQYRIAGTLPGISRARQLDERAGRFIIESEATDDSNGVFGRPEFRYLHVVTVPFDKTLLVAAYVARSVAKNTGYLWMKKPLTGELYWLARLFFGDDASQVKHMFDYTSATRGMKSSSLACVVRGDVHRAFAGIEFPMAYTARLFIEREVVGDMRGMKS